MPMTSDSKAQLVLTRRSICSSTNVGEFNSNHGLFEKQPKGTELLNHPREKPLGLNDRGMGAHFSFRILSSRDECV